jgi:hypothetical protein
MKLSNKEIGNSVDDDRYQAAVLEMQVRHGDEFEDVHNGSGRSEELPSDLARRHAEERSNLANDRDKLSIMEWVRLHGAAVTCPHWQEPANFTCQ